MYVFVFFLGSLVLTNGQFFDKKVENLGLEIDGLTVVKNTLETLIDNVTDLEKEIDALRSRSCASKCEDPEF